MKTTFPAGQNIPYHIQFSIPHSGMQPSLEGRCTPLVNANESLHHPVLFVDNVDKLAAAFKDPVGRFFWYRVQFGLLLALEEFKLCWH